ncbi:putative protein OS=Streptomyces rutgersensis OX=53451 GN=F0345_07090 PE=4 SV=1 [Streptomyces diastaticus subsp. diastaticus]|uniref:Uncharacterized protein n=4 Tax=Streptomyces TaxID=1883 RepID=A0A380NE85_STRGR|nr:hypothetical protein [Streptomyces sp. BRB081]NEE33334.1 hypothetical protein [Streptomyces sp. SID7982]NEE56717.1 hypothetical protein [Streptomyces sp. SID8455]QNE80914.1 hypothetical protein F0345_07090 [Streptomyces rutgersensis]SUP38820.1 Uncharacterised protein [Streptomyces griseus]
MTAMTKLYYRFVYWRRRLGRSVRPAAEPRRPAPARRRLAVKRGAYRFRPLYVFAAIVVIVLALSWLLAAGGAGRGPLPW